MFYSAASRCFVLILLSVQFPIATSKSNHDCNIDFLKGHQLDTACLDYNQHALGGFGRLLGCDFCIYVDFSACSCWQGLSQVGTNLQLEKWKMKILIQLTTESKKEKTILIFHFHF